jgi:homocysteine S-methyltransferase
MPGFTDFLKEQDIVLFPGATGTELQRRGFATTLPLWSASANLDGFDILTQIHRDYFLAGADICITNTFRTTPRTFDKVGRKDDAHRALIRGVDAAKEAQKIITDRPTFIGGSFATLEDCYEPDLVPDDASLNREHEEQAQWLAAEGVDFMMPETINSLRESIAMARAASNTGLPFIISFVTRENGDLFDGTPLKQVIDATDFPGRVAVSVNCRPIDIIDGAFDALRAATDLPLGIYPNGIGHPHDVEGWIFENNPDSIAKFTTAALGWRDKGAKILGGCCGTTPDYIAALAKAVR